MKRRQRRYAVANRIKGVLQSIVDRSKLIWGEKRNRGKPDAVAAACDAEFLALGASVVKLDGVGDDVPDRIIGIAGLNVWCEYKTGKNEMSPGQEAFSRLWRGGDIWEIRTPSTCRLLLVWARREQASALRPAPTTPATPAPPARPEPSQSPARAFGTRAIDNATSPPPQPGG